MLSKIYNLIFQEKKTLFGFGLNKYVVVEEIHSFTFIIYNLIPTLSKTQILLTLLFHNNADRTGRSCMLVQINAQSYI